MKEEEEEEEEEEEDGAEVYLNHDYTGFDQMYHHLPRNLPGHPPPLERVGDVKVEGRLQFSFVAGELSQTKSGLGLQQRAPVPSLQGIRRCTFLLLLLLIAVAGDGLRGGIVLRFLVSLFP